MSKESPISDFKNWPHHLINSRPMSQAAGRSGEQGGPSRSWGRNDLAGELFLRILTVAGLLVKFGRNFWREYEGRANPSYYQGSIYFV